MQHWIRKKDGEDYERLWDPDGPLVMVTGIDRYLVENRWKLSIMRDREF